MIKSRMFWRHGTLTPVGGAVLFAFVVGLVALAVVANALVLVMTANAASDRRSVAGDDVQVFNLAGGLSVVAGTGRDVEVEVTRAGADGERLSIETGTLSGHPTLRVLYPGTRVRYPGHEFHGRTTIEVDRDGRFNQPGLHGGLGFDRRRVTITDGAGGIDAHADLRVSVPRGRHVSVYLGVGRATVTNVDGDLLVDVAAAEVVASGSRGRLRVDTGSGDVDVRDANADVTIDTGSGDVSVSRIRGTRLGIDTGSGAVRGSDVTVEKLGIDTGSGGIDVSGLAAAEVSLDTGSGDVRVGLASDIERLHVDTGSGDVIVHAPPSLGAQISIESSSGGIETDFPVQTTEHARDTLRGRIGDGRGHIDIDTGSGAVRLLRS